MSIEQGQIRRAVPAKEIPFEEAWQKIERILDTKIRGTLLEGGEPTLDIGSYSELYTMAYNLCLARKKDRISGTMEGPTNLYSALSAYFFALADELLEPISTPTPNDFAFLTAYLEVYDRYLETVLLLSKALAFLDRHYLKRSVDEWFNPQKPSPETPALEPGMYLGNPNPPKVTIRNGQRIMEAVPVESLVPMPMERAKIRDEIMRWEENTPAGAPDEEETKKLLWPPERDVHPGEESTAQAKDATERDARRYSSLPGNVYVYVKPTMLRLWRLTTSKHFGTNKDVSMVDIMQRMKVKDASSHRDELTRRMGRCFWAAGVLEQDLGFGVLLDVLRPAA